MMNLKSFESRGRVSSTALLVAALMAFSFKVQAQDLTGVKCIVHGEASATAEASVEYRDAKVFFCCDNCAETFKQQKEDQDSPLLIKANHQLVLTGQYIQTVCPLTGREVVSDKSVEVGGVNVGVCCGGCESKLKGATELPDRAKLVFANASFEKGFAKKQAPKLEGVNCFIMTRKELKADFSSDYGEHKVFFCCRNCLNRFNNNPDSYVTKANHQLVKTEQVKQAACPISGSPVDESQSTEVAGVKVKFCCGNCKGKVENTEGDPQLELVFGKENFSKGFK